MTAPKRITLAKRTLAQLADRVTEYLLGEQTVVNANMALVAIREQAQDALGEIMSHD